ncbi:MAG: hypothetical protein HMLKMBBP_03713 [Planctomycetes bacterium]|nr:hypothetical protein [Planctomycetota bacterium]
MTAPRWDDPTLRTGTMVRSALWLIQAVGRGNTFTKGQHRDAFPGIAQADRRLRDLRKHGWVIHTCAEDATLRADEQRFVAEGAAVWEPRSTLPAAQRGVSAKERRRILAADDHQCVTCGIAAGESYPDLRGVTAVLTVNRRERSPGVSETPPSYVTECRRCRDGAASPPPTIDTVLGMLRALTGPDRDRFAIWIEQDRRDADPIDRAWTAYRQLPAAKREELRQQLGRARE